MCSTEHRSPGRRDSMDPEDRDNLGNPLPPIPVPDSTLGSPYENVRISRGGGRIPVPGASGLDSSSPSTSPTHWEFYHSTKARQGSGGDPMSVWVQAVPMCNMCCWTDGIFWTVSVVSFWLKTRSVSDWICFGSHMTLWRLLCWRVRLAPAKGLNRVGSHSSPTLCNLVDIRGGLISFSFIKENKLRD
jgi:hypothetical protein